MTSQSHADATAGQEGVVLSRSALLRVKEQLKAALGAANAKRVEEISGLLGEDGKAPLGDVLGAIYAGTTLDQDSQLSNFRQFRRIVNEAARGANLRLTLQTDGQKKRTKPEDRAVWFAGEDRIKQGVDQMVDAEAFGVQRVAQTGVALGTRQGVRYRVVRAEGEGEELLTLLESHLLHSEDYSFEESDSGDCDLLLEFVSPRHPEARDRTCRMVPVQLEPVGERAQGFTYRGKAWSEWGPQGQAGFAAALFAEICVALQKPWTLHLPEIELPYFAPTQGVRTELDKLDPMLRGERHDALAFLHRWCQETAGPRYCALLGEYGIGKTTTCKALAKERREQNLATIYLDLRLVGRIESDQEIELTRIVDRVLQRSWKSGELKAALQAEEAIKLVREQGALIIFDGLDEVLVHLSPVQGQHFTRELFRVLPPSLASRGWMLLTCRSHFFRSFRDQVAHLTAQDRDRVGKEEYRALVLLPFTEEQIRNYLAQTLPGEDPGRVLALFGSVHNLREMAERPYTLSLLVERLAEIEKWKAGGEKITAFRLYEHIVRAWVERDAGKHTLQPDHKIALMEFFAAELWRSGRQVWRILEIENWMLRFLQREEEIAAHYVGVDRQVLKEDLRTATFLVREGEDGFRFAHTSLLEFFLAGYLRGALETGRLERWVLQPVSRETLDFLGQALERGGVEPLRKLRDEYVPQASELAFEYYLVASGRGYPRISGSGFQLPGADFRGRTFEKVVLPRINLRGARLRQSVWADCDLSGAEFGAAGAARAEWHRCRMAGSRWEGAVLTGANFRDCGLSGTDFAGAVTDRTFWLGCRLEGAAGISKDAVQERGMERHSDVVYESSFSPDGRWLVTASGDRTLILRDGETGAALRRLEGHEEGVLTCGFSPDGERIVSGSSDGSLRIWDRETGVSLLQVEAHEGAVHGCGFSPDGRRVVSGGADGVVRVADAATGEELLGLEGHEGAVLCCAYAPDRRQVASGAVEGTVRIWNAESGAEEVRIRCGGEMVVTLAYSPNGRRVIAGTEDGALQVWDARTGESLLEIASGDAPVLHCSYSPDGSRVVAALGDRSLRVWDAETGEVLLEPAGWEDAVQVCRYSPDGRRLVAGNADGSLRVRDAVTGESLVFLAGQGRLSVQLGPLECAKECAFSPDGNRILTAGDGVQIWDVKTGEKTLDLSTHGAGKPCAYSPDGRSVASAVEGGAVVVWDAETGAERIRLEGHAPYVADCAYSPDGRRLASAAGDGAVRIWDLDSGKCLRRFESLEGPATHCVVSPDGRHVAAASQAGTVRVWDVANGQRLVSFQTAHSWLNGLQYSPDGSRLATGAYNEGLMQIWDAASGEMLSEFSPENPIGFDYSPDGKHLLIANDSVLGICDAETGEWIIPSIGPEDVAHGCAFSPDGSKAAWMGFMAGMVVLDVQTGERLLEVLPRRVSLADCAVSTQAGALVTTLEDGSARIWEVTTGKSRAIVPKERRGEQPELFDYGVPLLERERYAVLAKLPIKGIRSSGFSSDGSRVITGLTDGTVRVWNLRTSELLRTLLGDGGTVHAIAYSADGRRIVSASADHTLRLWDAETGECLLAWEGPTAEITRCLWAPDGRSLLSGERGGVLRMWDTETAEELHCMPDHVWGVEAFGYSPGGERIMSLSGDGAIRMWDRDSGEEMWALPPYRTAAKQCAFSADGRRLASAGADGVLRFWDVETGKQVGWEGYEILDGGTFSVELRPRRILFAEPNAWRYIRWETADAKGVRQLVPAGV